MTAEKSNFPECVKPYGVLNKRGTWTLLPFIKAQALFPAKEVSNNQVACASVTFFLTPKSSDRVFFENPTSIAISVRD